MLQKFSTDIIWRSNPDL